MVRGTSSHARVSAWAMVRRTPRRGTTSPGVPACDWRAGGAASARAARDAAAAARGGTAGGAPAGGTAGGRAGRGGAGGRVLTGRGAPGRRALDVLAQDAPVRAAPGHLL